MFNTGQSQQPACHCMLKSPSDAIYILEAVRQGKLQRCSRRLTGNERARIGPGTVWVWEEEETNMRRWTDGRRWGASRVGAGGFLIYREVEGGTRGRHSTSPSLSPPPRNNGGSSAAGGRAGGYPGGSTSTNDPANAAGRSSRHNGLVKQTYSTTMHDPDSGQMKKFHVVAYYSKNDAAYEPLPQPHQLPQIEGLQIPPGVWADYQDVTQRGRPGEDGASRPGTASTSMRGAKGMDDPRRAYMPHPSYPAHPPPVGQPMHMAPFAPSHAGGYYNAPPPGQPHHMPYPNFYPLPPPPGMTPLPGQPGGALPPHGMTPYYPHPDMMYRYGTVTPPVSAESSATSANGHLPLPHGASVVQAGTGAAAGADRRLSGAPSKRTSVPRHLQSHSPYPQGSPSGRSSIGNGDVLSVDQMAGYPGAVPGQPYSASPNGSGSGGEMSHQQGARGSMIPGGYEDMGNWQSQQYGAPAPRHDDPRYATSSQHPHAYGQPYAPPQDQRGQSLHSPQQPSGRSPKDGEDRTAEESQDGGLTLPPIRATGDKASWRNGGSASGGDGHNDGASNGAQKDGEGNAGEDVDKRVHGEDARQLRELGKMVTL